MRHLLWLLVLSGLAAFTTSVQAAADYSEVRPGPEKSGPLAFDVHSERLPDGKIQFTIKVAENIGSESRFLHFPEHFSTYLGIAKVVNYSDEDRKKNPNSLVRSEEYSFLRSVQSDRKDNVVTCIFSVTEKELEDPDFCFFVSEVANGPLPGFSAWFARLKKFWKP